MIQKELGTGYFGILDRLHTYISDYDMDKAYDVIENSRQILGGCFSEKDSFGYR